MASGEHFFGVQRGRLSARDVARRERLARQHGATFVYTTLPGDGPQSWFAVPNMGEPFNGARARAVLDALDGERQVRR